MSPTPITSSSLIEEYAPNFRSLVLAREVLTPLDLERRFGITGGNIFHGEMSLDQMFVMRPVAGWARYRTPINGLYLCGSGAHPGGGVMGAPGYNAARAILKSSMEPPEQRRRRVGLVVAQGLIPPPARRPVRFPSGSGGTVARCA